MKTTITTIAILAAIAAFVPPAQAAVVTLSAEIGVWRTMYPSGAAQFAADQEVAIVGSIHHADETYEEYVTLLWFDIPAAAYLNAGCLYWEDSYVGESDGDWNIAIRYCQYDWRPDGVYEEDRKRTLWAYWLTPGDTGSFDTSFQEYFITGLRQCLPVDENNTGFIWSYSPCNSKDTYDEYHDIRLVIDYIPEGESTPTGTPTITPAQTPRPTWTPYGTQPTPWPTSTDRPTYTPEPTATPRATDTPFPTATSRATYTPDPTYTPPQRTPAATYTPRPTYTPHPTLNPDTPRPTDIDRDTPTPFPTATYYPTEPGARTWTPLPTATAPMEAVLDIDVTVTDALTVTLDLASPDASRLVVAAMIGDAIFFFPGFGATPTYMDAPAGAVYSGVLFSCPVFGISGVSGIWWAALIDGDYAVLAIDGAGFNIN